MAKLDMAFQPIFMAGLALREIDPSLWQNKVRPAVVALTRPKCSVCGFVAEEARSIIHADEVWAFKAPASVTLADVRPLCVRCHEAKDYAELVRRSFAGAAAANRTLVAMRHYCQVNECSAETFYLDYAAARKAVKALETAFLGNNVQVDYGSWDRPAELTRLTPHEDLRLKALFDVLTDPVEYQGHTISTYPLAVRFLMTVRVPDRQAFFDYLGECVCEQYEDDAPLMERDEAEAPWG